MADKPNDIDQNMHAAIERGVGDAAHLAVISPLIQKRNCSREIQLHHIPEIHPVLGEIANPLALVPLELHTPIVCTISPEGKP